MNEEGPPTGDTRVVTWRRLPTDAVPPPVVRSVPYLELKLEHPDLKPTGYGAQFFPDMVPYRLDGRDRVFYWRPALSSSSTSPADWEVACATTHELTGAYALPFESPSLFSTTEDRISLVVDGTVGGESTTARVRSYAPPTVSLVGVTASEVRLRVNRTLYRVSSGQRRRITLDEQSLAPIGTEMESTAVIPELAVRYPGRREIHHPAPGASSQLFPSFGLTLDEIPNPLPVPTVAGELDGGALAAELGIALTERPYPERVLWQAFSYTAFDPHSERTPEVAQLSTGHLALRTERTDP